MKISVIGAGNVGATCANVIALKELANEVVLLDIKEGIAEGKALDISQSLTLLESNVRVTGSTNDYSKTANSEVVVITSGVPRKPGMSRDDLISINAGIVTDVATKVLEHSPEAILIIVSNPLDVLCHVVQKATKLPYNRVIGMAGVLDVARYSYFIADALNVKYHDVQAQLMGGHGDMMVPLKSYTSIAGVPISELMEDETLNQIIERTKFGGGELVKLIGTSAWIAPGTAAAIMVESIVKDNNRICSACVHLDGEYGIEDLYLGVPVRLGKQGLKEIVKLKITEEEMTNLHKSASSVREIVEKL